MLRVFLRRRKNRAKNRADRDPIEGALKMLIEKGTCGLERKHGYKGNGVVPH